MDGQQINEYAERISPYHEYFGQQGEERSGYAAKTRLRGRQASTTQPYFLIGIAVG